MQLSKRGWQSTPPLRSTRGGSTTLPRARGPIRSRWHFGCRGSLSASRANGRCPTGLLERRGEVVRDAKAEHVIRAVRPDERFEYLGPIGTAVKHVARVDDGVPRE